jgi:hypothetical protein
MTSLSAIRKPHFSEYLNVSNYRIF